jgi:hypothetical protein
MMKKLFSVILLLFFFSCASFPRNAITKTKLELEGLYYADLPRYLPEDWELIKELWQRLEEVEKSGDVEEAYRLYYYANYKIAQIDEKLTLAKKEEEEKIKQAKKVIEDEKLKNIKETEEEKTKNENGLLKSDITMETTQITKVIAGIPKPKKTAQEIRSIIEKRFPSFYTVKEDDSLDKIAELPYIYNDKYYWPLIYKYNRDQISNPKKLYKGQILRIPRNISMEEIYNARKEAGAQHPKILPKRAYTPEKYKQMINELLLED